MATWQTSILIAVLVLLTIYFFRQTREKKVKLLGIAAAELFTQVILPAAILLGLFWLAEKGCIFKGR